MKTIYLLLFAALLGQSTVIAQIAKDSGTGPYPLDIAYSKTTSIIFPYAIHSVDRGSQEILVQKAIGLENVLQVKAAKHDFLETNLTVVTADGKLYNFALHYCESPQDLTYTFDQKDKTNQITYSDSNDNQKNLIYGAELAYHERKKVSYKENTNGISLSVTGVFIHNDLIHYRITITNDTHISYDIDQLRFFVRDQKTAKRTASQEVEIIPVWTYKALQKIPAKDAVQFVCVLPKFTIPDKKKLVIELIERSGGRHLQLELNNSKTDKVFPIPAFSN